MEDITPGLVERITEDFRRAYDESGKIQTLLEKVRKGTATYAEAQEYSLEVSRLIGKAYSKNISSAVLPDGRMYYNIASRLIPASMDENYALVSQYAASVQKELNRNAGIGIRAQVADKSQDRIDGLVELACGAERYDDVAQKLLSAFDGFSQSVVDDTIQKNAQLHYDAGMSPKIRRKAEWRCCDWCRALEGEYDYPDVPPDVYRRHERCRCTVLYDPADGKKLFQNVHSREWTDREHRISDYTERERRLAEEKTAQTIKRKFQAVSQNRVVEVMRQDSEQWIHSLNESERVSIRKYTGNGDTDPKLYQRINAMLRGDNPEDVRLRYHADNISGALKRCVLGENVICYRGVDVHPIPEVDIGTTIGLRQFISSTVIPNKAFDSGISMVIYALKGTVGAGYIESLSEFPKQREMLFDKDCKYVVLSNKENHIELVVVR